MDLRWQLHRQVSRFGAERRLVFVSSSEEPAENQIDVAIEPGGRLNAERVRENIRKFDFRVVQSDPHYPEAQQYIDVHSQDVVQRIWDEHALWQGAVDAWSEPSRKGYQFQ